MYTTRVFILCCVGFTMYVSVSTYTLIFCVPNHIPIHGVRSHLFLPVFMLCAPCPSSHLLLLPITELRAFTGRMPPRRSPTTAARSTPRLKVHVGPNSSHGACTHLLIVHVHTYLWSLYVHPRDLCTYNLVVLHASWLCTPPHGPCTYILMVFEHSFSWSFRTPHGPHT